MPKKLVVKIPVLGLVIGALIFSIGLVKKTTRISPEAAENEAIAYQQELSSDPEATMPGWQLIFVDHFNTDVPVGGFSNCTTKLIGTNPNQHDWFQSDCPNLPPAVRRKWAVYPDGWNDGFFGTYYPSRVLSIRDGKMIVKLHSKQIRGKWLHLISTQVPKIPNQPGPEGGQTYGRYAIRFKIDPVCTGYKIAWLLWPDSEVWPRDGEIDFPEVDDFTNYSRIYGAVHYALNGKDYAQLAHSRTKPADGKWHTAITEWTEDYVEFFLDDKRVGKIINKNIIPRTPMTWRIQSQGMVYRATEPINNVAAIIQIDWVKVWKRI